MSYLIFVAIWWQSYGGSTPHLQEMAIRVLSQACSASGCELNWSVFEHIHIKKRNRLEHRRLNDLVFVQCNLHLRYMYLFMKNAYMSIIVFIVPLPAKYILYCIY